MNLSVTFRCIDDGTVACQNNNIESPTIRGINNVAISFVKGNFVCIL